jgi:AraC-like DNA-binding protein
LRLLDTPQHAAALTPLIRQEILYRLLAGPSGSRLLEISRQDSPSNRIARALTWLQKQFTKGFMVDDLARRVGMSPSSFHQHFKAMTGMTPIQYQRRIRLHEARKLLLVDSLGIGEASYRVGYQSPSQFTKDYRQCFSRLPKDDIQAHATERVTFSGYSPEMSLR